MAAPSVLPDHGMRLSMASKGGSLRGILHRGSWLLCLLWLLCATVHAEDPWAPFDAPWFDRLSTTDGLPHSITTAIAQDHRGLVWIGSMGGLVRYDGYRMQVFTGT